ncbi:hypothetical protein BGX26_005889 [Mortierella sp. AD094]|nr:hypothetical protein BGX26_005889 [Mortierella sp. AD094]
MPRHYDLCARVQNGFRARLRRIAVPDTKMNHAIANVLYKEGFIAGVSRGDHIQPDSAYVPTTPDNVATRRLWLELKYNNDEPVLKKMSAPGEIAILTTNYGVLELREALEKGAGGEVFRPAVTVYSMLLEKAKMRAERVFSFHAFPFQPSLLPSQTSITIPPIKLKTLLAVVATILVMTRARQIQSNYHQAKTASLSVSNNLRRRRPRTKDTLDKEKRIRLLDEAIVTGNIEALRRLSVTANEKNSHKDEEQVRLDVIRSFTHLATDTMVLGKEAAMPAAESLAMFFFRDCMLDNLEPVLDQLSLMTALLKLEDPEVQEFLDKSETLPFFPLSWVITWCSHDLQDFEKIARIYDFLMCFNPLMSVYLAAAVVMSRREELFEVECDNAMVHSFLTKFPKNADLELIISHAHKLYVTYPPEALQNRAQSWLDENSCVNTFNKSNACLYDDNDEKAYSTPVDFEPIDNLLGKPRVKRTAESSALSKYPPNAVHLYRRNMITMVAFSAASVGTAALLLLNSALLREWLNSAGLR